MEKLIKMKKCFFITPIGAAESDQFKKLNGLKDGILKDILNKYSYDLIIAHEIQQTGSINDQLIRNIIEADLILTNLTGLNPNVMYELGIAHTLNKPNIMICENGTNLPFDITTERTIFYTDSISGAKLLADNIDKRLRFIEESGLSDTPVSRQLDINYFTNQYKKENKKMSIQDQLILDIYERVVDIEHHFKSDELDKLSKNAVERINDEQFDHALQVFNQLRIDLERQPSSSEIAAELDVPEESIYVEYPYIVKYSARELFE